MLHIVFCVRKLMKLPWAEAEPYLLKCLLKVCWLPHVTKRCAARAHSGLDDTSEPLKSSASITCRHNAAEAVPCVGLQHVMLLSVSLLLICTGVSCARFQHIALNINLFTYLCLCLLQHRSRQVSRVRFQHIALIASLAGGLAQYHDSLGVGLVDLVLEDVR
jgi:hypothetical protein